MATNVYKAMQIPHGFKCTCGSTQVDVSQLDLTDENSPFVQKCRDCGSELMMSRKEAFDKLPTITGGNFNPEV